jgi:hypothetical protein
MKCNGLYFDRFDICEAYYLFAVYYHLGQWSKEYEIFGRLQKIGFNKPYLNDLKTEYKRLSENGKMIFKGLIEAQKKREYKK